MVPVSRRRLPKTHKLLHRYRRRVRFVFVPDVSTHGPTDVPPPGSGVSFPVASSALLGRSWKGRDRPEDLHPPGRGNGGRDRHGS